MITTGFGAMVSYANRINVEDRWAIVAYIRALQLKTERRWHCAILMKSVHKGTRRTLRTRT